MNGRVRVIIGVEDLAGHALPALALARSLAARGHEVLVHAIERWRPMVDRLGLRFDGGTDEIVSDASAADGRVAVIRALAASAERFGADVVVSDALTLTPALAAEAAGIRRAILFPEVYPYVTERELPPFSLGLLPPRTRLGAATWRLAAPLARTRLPSTAWLRASRTSLNAERRALGLAPLESFDRPRADELHLVATLPHLEYPRVWPANVQVTGPLILDPPAPAVKLPPGNEPLVLVAPSTAKDPDGRLVRTSIAALADEPVRILVTLSGRRDLDDLATPPNCTVVDWVDFSLAIPAASLVVCHGNHGTVVRALSEGVPVLVSPAMPDDAEHGARVAWAGAGAMVPGRLLGAASLRAAARRLLAGREYVERARQIAGWAREHDGAERAAALVEEHACA
ncbi:MAG TPA: nucleotide disphospho-sugar-binding domain-containing protein [Solirubrobacterales bacterium]|nr:nucleotide disphospho-sugar-binding domain-containing protein [Solirubrobacterales bacterium]